VIDIFVELELADLLRHILNSKCVKSISRCFICGCKTWL